MNKSRNNTYRSPKEWEEIFKAYDASNLSKAVFCRKYGIKSSTFIDRDNKRRRKGQAESKVTYNNDTVPDFIPVTVSKEVVDTSDDNDHQITVTIGKASITLTKDFDLVFFKSVASALAELC